MQLKKTLISVSAVAGLLFTGGVTASAAENNSIVDYLYNKGEDYHFANRSQLAQQHGISGYRGTADQNITLLNKLRGTQSEPSKGQAQVQAVPNQNPTPAPVEKKETPVQPQGRTLTVEATAYTKDCSGCSGVTATGIDLNKNPNQKIIAVDPTVIPLGKHVLIEGYGTYLAADLGGAIKGQRIDVLVQSESEALAFGRRQVKVTILD